MLFNTQCYRRCVLADITNGGWLSGPCNSPTISADIYGATPMCEIYGNFAKTILKVKINFSNKSM
jgi:hypothetical protein